MSRIATYERDSAYYPANDPRHPTYSGVEAHCMKSLADAAPNAYSREDYERCVREKPWRVLMTKPTGRMKHGAIIDA